MKAEYILAMVQSLEKRFDELQFGEEAEAIQNLLSNYYKQFNSTKTLNRVTKKSAMYSKKVSDYFDNNNKK
jgi:mevalonate pyrophosphate decarboxylase